MEWRCGGRSLSLSAASWPMPWAAAGAGKAVEGEVSIKKDARWERIRAQALELAASGKFRYWHPIEVVLCKTFPANEVRFAFDPEMRAQLDVVCKEKWTK